MDSISFSSSTLLRQWEPIFTAVDPQTLVKLSIASSTFLFGEGFQLDTFLCAKRLHLT
ncbi:DEKNAAC102603 [Brettanomyces naardenensis]|uniref:DEKNAAC102603 n=1 Tax=Brettanomyces naardenensis TaxID=13370 RepID=A0A448YKW4_BRENA|nr:DEKNAAC102603 [Brettanomyces naardenensis]